MQELRAETAQRRARGPQNRKGGADQLLLSVRNPAGKTHAVGEVRPEDHAGHESCVRARERPEMRLVVEKQRALDLGRECPTLREGGARIVNETCKVGHKPKLGRPASSNDRRTKGRPKGVAPQSLRRIIQRMFDRPESDPEDDAAQVAGGKEAQSLWDVGHAA